MASPSVEDTSTSSDSGAGTHTHDYPGTMSVGNTVICVLAIDSDDETPTWPSTGDNIFNEIFTTGAQGVTLSIAWHEVTGGEGATFDITGLGNEVSGACCYCVQLAADPADAPPEVSSGASGSSSTPDPDEITASLTGYDNMFIGCMAADRRAVNGFPANCPDSNISVGAGGASDASAAMASEQATADSFNPDTFSIAAGDGWVAATVVVYESGAAPPAGQPWHIRDNYPLPASLGFGPG